MARTGRPTVGVTLAEDERAQLTRWARQGAPALALRSRIVLACAGGAANTVVARRLELSEATVGKWRRRFLAYRLDGLFDRPRPGRPPVIGPDQIEDVLATTAESAPEDAPQWSRAAMARSSGLSKSTVGRIWQTFDLRPHQTVTEEPELWFVEKIYDVVGLYLNPPQNAVALCVDENSRVRAQAIGGPVPPTVRAVGAELDSLIARLEPLAGNDSPQQRRLRTIEFRRFLTAIDDQVPGHLDVHVITERDGPHRSRAITLWKQQHPRFHLHHPPNCEWSDQFDRLLGYASTDLARRGNHLSVRTLHSDLRDWCDARASEPFVWVRSTAQILRSLAGLQVRINGAGD